MQNETNRREKAMELFAEGYNCAQAVVLAFEDILPLKGEHLSKLASSFGGGMGRLREVCGAVSGIFMVCGLLYGYNGPEKGEKKAEHYKRIQALAHEFESTHGSIVCRELLGVPNKHDSPIPEERTKEYYQKRPCKEIVGDAVEVLNSWLENQNQED